MEDIIKKDISDVLKKTLQVLNQSDPSIFELKKLSNRTIHDASIYQDEYSISTAILIYSISKIIERVGPNLDYPKLKNLLSHAIGYLDHNDVESFQDFIHKIFTVISRTDHKFKFYVQEVINQAKIRKGSKIYAHGISAAKAAAILGVSLWDFYDYLGATTDTDVDSDISSVRDKLRYTRSLFR